MADQPITSLPIKTASGMAATDYLLGIDSAEGYQMLIQDLGDYIIQHATSSLAGQSQTLAQFITKNDILSGNKTLIPDNSNINTYITQGVYSVASDASAATISNLPRAASGKLIVLIRGNNSNYLQQRYIPTSVSCIEYVRNYNAGVFTAWEMLPTRSDINNTYLLRDGTTLSNNTDFNSLTTPGRYVVLSWSASRTMGHIPEEMAGVLIVEASGPTSNPLPVFQRYSTYSTENIYIRSYAENSWSDWKKMPTRAEITSLITDTYSLFGGTSIPDGSDLDTYLTPGNYYKDSSSGAATLSNCPAAVAFTLKVEIGNGIDGNYGWKCRIQTFKSWYGLISYVRYASYDNSTWTWSDWSKDPTREEVDEISNKVTTIFISNGSDFNNFVLPGIYGVNSNSGATNLVNCPDKVAGVLTVKVGAGIQGDFTKELAIGYQFWETYLGTTYFRRIGTDGSKQFVADSWIKEPTRAEIDALNINTLKSTGSNHTIETAFDSNFCAFKTTSQNGNTTRLVFYDTGKVEIIRYADGSWKQGVTLREADS